MNHSQAVALKADFDRDGVVIIRDFVTPETAREICDRAEAATKALPIRHDPFSNVTKGLERLDEYFGELLHRGPQVPVLETLLGKKPEPTTASFFTKDENHQEVHPHSDAMDGVVTWIALDETNERNGGLQFLKGSHRRREEFRHLRAHTPTDLSDHPDRFEAAMSPGDIVIFRPTTVHWSGPNHDGSIRRGFNCFYVGNPFKGGKRGRMTGSQAAKKAKLAAMAK
ncbi:MAG: phytanoyl-CoA dioxygenase family protein [Gammaproteobacteria bacterium]|nr:phytanoyl-CoA dioxygenase family protein [Gammaproteobacteria bacterium]